MRVWAHIVCESHIVWRPTRIEIAPTSLASILFRSPLLLLFLLLQHNSMLVRGVLRWQFRSCSHYFLLPFWHHFYAFHLAEHLIILHFFSYFSAPSVFHSIRFIHIPDIIAKLSSDIFHSQVCLIPLFALLEIFLFIFWFVDHPFEILLNVKPIN